MANTGMLVSMKPTSVDHSGTSASVNNNGGVDFSAVTSLSLNGVFTSDYDNYVLVMDHVGSGSIQIASRLRLSGSDASGSDYVFQQIVADGGTRSGERATSQNKIRISPTQTTRGGLHLHLYGPSLAQPTAFRSVTIEGFTGARIFDYAATHSLSTAYDGITIYPESGNITGNVAVFGYRE